ncbi:MAG TPA: hypothetical protein VIL35_11220 [Vicinamibacterales bacterium]
MTAPAAASIVRPLALVLSLVAAGCTNFYEIPIETPIQAKLDITPFQRVHVVGFIAGGSDDVDANLETVRLLRSQLRTRSGLRVIEADVLPLAEIAQEMSREAPVADPAPAGAPGTTGPAGELNEPAGQSTTGNGGAVRIRDEKGLAAYEQIFANVEYWKKIGEEYQQPLIVTGTVLFMPQSKNGVVAQTREGYDQFGRRYSYVQRVYMERKGYVLRPKFIFIDGRTGTRLYSESFREERLYPSQQNVPALSSYFELMDDVIPRFLNVLSTQKVRGTRVLLK